MYSKVLIANRGEIACRIQKTLKKMGIESLAIYSEIDKSSLHVRGADHAICIGPAQPAESYLNYQKILDVAKQNNVEAIHPGYGFLSENTTFAKACIESNIAFIGPDPKHIKMFGLKHEAREIASSFNVPLVPGSPLLDSLDDALVWTKEHGFPVMLKSTAGGGGIGMRGCDTQEELVAAWESVKRLSQANFSHSGMYIERWIKNPRHIEVQVFGDGAGKAIILGDRDCSIQRRNQKVIEEAPASFISEQTRTALHKSAHQLIAGTQYKSAGTVEFLYDASTEDFYFLEVNTRLQVEHGVTEEVFNIDLVEWMIRLSYGDTSMFNLPTLYPTGHAIEVRVYAENPTMGFTPSTGIINTFAPSAELRVDTWVESGQAISPYYDPLIAKYITKAADRLSAIQKMHDLLDPLAVLGVENNVLYCKKVLANKHIQNGNYSTHFLKDFKLTAPMVQVLEGGAMTTIQDYPGRSGYWDVGVPPSGPFDSLSFRLANLLLGNQENLPALEITLTGPTLHFYHSCYCALTGSEIEAKIEMSSGVCIDVKNGIAFFVESGSKLILKKTGSKGLRSYLAFKGGLNVPTYLNSASTFSLGGFGGYTGKPLKPGDSLYLTPSCTEKSSAHITYTLPELQNTWEIAVQIGPHGTNEFFTPSDMETFFQTDWKVHYNSDRTGIRLIGPKPNFARKDGGEAGLHPSNIHDNAYAFGTLDITGDMPIFLGPDGPSLGGFVCPVTTIESELWKLGQLKPGDTVRLSLVNDNETQDLRKALAQWIHTGKKPSPIKQSKTISSLSSSNNTQSCILYSAPENQQSPSLCIRSAGDRFILVEYGPVLLDLTFRFRVHALQTEIKKLSLHGIEEMTPGVRSLQIHYHPGKAPKTELVQLIVRINEQLADLSNVQFPVRKVKLPLSWDDESIHLIIQRYITTVRNNAPWCPNNIEFIRRINGLDSIDNVKKMIFEAKYLVLGLGDVYLGAPVATPLDPRHRLVTTKYNPARTWTLPNVVGIGGAYMCVYGMEGPGGYQLFGRTIPVWSTYQTKGSFKDHKPWLLRFFDIIEFYPVTHDKLMQMREDLVWGQFEIDVQEENFSVGQYMDFLKTNHSDIEQFRLQQRKAFADERDAWTKNGEFDQIAKLNEVEQTSAPAIDTPDDCIAIYSPTPGSVWKIQATVGTSVSKEDTLLILESMKMEFPVSVTEKGVLQKLFIHEGQIVASGDLLAWIKIDG